MQETRALARLQATVPTTAKPGAGLLAGVVGADGLALGEWIFTRVTVSGSSSTPSLCAASASIL